MSEDLQELLKISDNEIQFLTGIEDYDEGINKLRSMYNIPLICLTLGEDVNISIPSETAVEQAVTIFCLPFISTIQTLQAEISFIPFK